MRSQRGIAIWLGFSLVLCSVPRHRPAAAAPTQPPRLTSSVANRVLQEQIDYLYVGNTVFTCRACFDPYDKGENTRLPVVTTHGGLNAFLRRQGYIRIVAGIGEVFTAKAKRSPYFVGQGIDGRFAGAGFRFAHFRRPRLLGRWNGHVSHVPVEYDFVPTPPAAPYYGRIYQVRTFVSYDYGNGHWNICIACRRRG